MITMSMPRCSPLFLVPFHFVAFTTGRCFGSGRLGLLPCLFFSFLFSLSCVVSGLQRGFAWFLQEQKKDLYLPFCLRGFCAVFGLDELRHLRPVSGI